MSHSRATERILANTVHAILKRPETAETVLDQAASAGFSREYWARLFSRTIGESPAVFVRRIRIEKARHLLSTTEQPVHEIAIACGYSNAAAFCRAFARVVGCPPAEFRANPFRIEDAVGIHWIAHWDELDSDESMRMTRRFPMLLRVRPATPLAVQTRLGSYAYIGDFLAEVVEEMRFVGISPEARRFFTIYHNSIYTHPTSDGMRSQLGFQLRPGETAPAGFQVVTLPGGTYSTFEHPVVRTDRNDAWTWMSRQRLGPGVSFDEYENFPLPWPESLTRLWVRVR